MIEQSTFRPEQPRGGRAIKVGAEGARRNHLRSFCFVGALLFCLVSSLQAQSSAGLSNYTQALIRQALQQKPVKARESATPPVPKPVVAPSNAVPTAVTTNSPTQVSSTPAEKVAPPMPRKEMLVRTWDEAISNGWQAALKHKPAEAPVPERNLPTPAPTNPPAAALPPSPASTNGGLVLYLPFEEGKGSVTRDLSGYGLIAQAMAPNTPVLWTNGLFGHAISTVNNNLFRLPHTNSLSGLGQMAISCWINSTSAPNSVNVWVSKHSGGTQGEFLLAGLTTNSIRWTLVNTNGRRINLDGACAPWNDGKWHNITGSFNGGWMALWFDNSVVNHVLFPGPLNSYESPIIIGDYDWNRFGYASFHYSGLIDEVKIWNRALTFAEVKELYEKGRGRDAASSR